MCLETKEERLLSHHMSPSHKSAVSKFEKLCEVENSGGRPIHRAREWIREARLERERKSGGKDQ